MKLLFMGDSTMQHNFASTYPQVGWPDALPLFILPTIRICNLAHNGCSTKSFIDLGFFESTLNTAEKGDYCFIQFGHNDEKKDNKMRYTDPYGSYSDNLRMFIDSLREKGVEPILLTPIYRRMFDEQHKLITNCHQDYPDAMINVAKEKEVYLIDLCKQTMDLINKLGEEESKRLFMHVPPNVYEKYPNGLIDNTHLRFDGAFEITRLVINQILEDRHPLRDIVKEEV